MASHACAQCGRPLDASNRRYLGDLGMWVARCPRCGDAVRWALRDAREPARIWARLRALNVRLGIAVSFGQLAGILLATLVFTILIGEMRPPAAARPSPLWWLSTPLPPLTALIGTAAGLAALAAAPWRGVIARTVGSWCVLILPTAGLLSAVLIADRIDRGFPDARIGDVLAGLVAIAVAAGLSFVVTFVAGALHRPAQRAIARRAARARRGAVATGMDAADPARTTGTPHP